MLNKFTKNKTHGWGGSPASVIWIGITQALTIAGSWAIVSGGNLLRMFTLGSVTLALLIPLMVGLEAGLIGMIIFEPFRGFLRRAQYLIVPYSSNEPIHLITPIVTIIAFLLVLAKEKLQMFWATPLAKSVSIFAAICGLQIFNPLQGNVFVGLTGGLFLLIPVFWFYFGQAANENLFPRVLKIVVILGIVSSLYGIYQMTFGYPSFELYWLENTDKYTSVSVYNVTRAIATFSNAEEWGRYVMIAALAAFGLAAMRSEGNKRTIWLISGIILCGMLTLTGQRSSIFGLFSGLAILILTGSKTFTKALGRIVLLSLPFIFLFTFTNTLGSDDIYELDESRKMTTMFSHTAKGTVDPTGEGSLYARFESWSYFATEVIPRTPFGLGLGARTLAASRGGAEQARSGAIDNYFIILTVSAGIPALLVLLWLLFQAFGYCIKLWQISEPDEDNFALARIAMAILFSTYILNNFFGTSFLIYSTAPLGWLLLGWISRMTFHIAEKGSNELE